jgi:molybdopterin-guanine dinucleotide biosynthesis protein A
LDRSAIVLAGGSSKRFGEDKGIVKFAGKPLLCHVVDAVRSVADELIVVTNSAERAERYKRLVGEDVRFVVDVAESEGPLIGALTGFGVARRRFGLVLPSDTPFVSVEVIGLLFELCVGRSAVIPRWPNGQIEPLHAVYAVDEARIAAKAAVTAGRLDMRGMIERMRMVRFVSTLVIAELDAELRSFFNINTPLDLKKAEKMLKQRKRR